MRDSGAADASRPGAMAGRPRTRFERVPGWMLAAALGVSVGQGQFPPMEHRMRAEEERATAEHWRQLEAAYEARRARALARLGSAASSVEPQALCPAFVGPTPVTRTFGTNARIPIRPFVPRSARRPTTPRWRDVAPASESSASLFSDHISQQERQAVMPRLPALVAGCAAFEAGTPPPRITSMASRGSTTLAAEIRVSPNSAFQETEDRR